MRLASLGSGSKGNATLIQSDSLLLMLDCGFSLKQVRLRMQRLGLQAEALQALLITHEHSDHVAGVARLSQQLEIPIYATQGTLSAARLEDLPQAQIIVPGQAFTLADLEILPVAVPHDAREPCQFVFRHRDKQRSLGILTDTGSITPHLLTHYRDLDAILVESNYDPELLRCGTYPESIKQRIASDFGHLSNQQSLEFLLQISHYRSPKIFIGHISEKNNCRTKLESIYQQTDLDPVFIDQQQGLVWQTL